MFCIAVRVGMTVKERNKRHAKYEINDKTIRFTYISPLTPTFMID